MATTKKEFLANIQGYSIFLMKIFIALLLLGQLILGILFFKLYKQQTNNNQQIRQITKMLKAIQEQNQQEQSSEPTPPLHPWNHNGEIVRKPVIYLYPTKTMHVSVKLKGDFKITESIPSYNNNIGWQVMATPNGIINNKYPYLYYEATIHEFSPVKLVSYSWNIPKNNFTKSMKTILNNLGLNSREINNFLEYWQDQLAKELPHSSCYYVGLLNSNKLEKYLALEISPKPNTEIRTIFVFQTSNKCGNYTNIQTHLDNLPQTPQRKGFTIVEWGGVVVR